MHIISNIALISINETLFVQLISFLIFLFIINRVMFRPLLNTMDERADYIKKIKSDIVEVETEFQNLTRRLDEKESNVKKEALIQKKSLEKKGKQTASEMLVSTQRDVDALKKMAEKEVEAKVMEAKKDFIKESEALAFNIMEKVLDRRLNV